MTAWSNVGRPPFAITTKNQLKYSVCCHIRLDNLKNRPCVAQEHNAQSIHSIFGKIPPGKGHEVELLRPLIICAALHLSVHLTLGLLQRRRRLNFDGGAPVGVQGDALQERPFVGVHDVVLPPR